MLRATFRLGAHCRLLYRIGFLPVSRHRMTDSLKAESVKDGFGRVHDPPAAGIIVVAVGGHKANQAAVATLLSPYLSGRATPGCHKNPAVGLEVTERMPYLGST